MTPEILTLLVLLAAALVLLFLEGLPVGLVALLRVLVPSIWPPYRSERLDGST